MKASEWNSKYLQIAADLGYSSIMDHRAAVKLDSILRRYPLGRLKKMISGRAVFVIGAGPSLDSALPVLKKHRDVLKICADTAARPLVKNGIIPQIIVTDLDGDLELLKRLGRTDTVFVVHAHGDNMDKLEFARNFRNCIGTTQTRKTGRVYNFGGFTDGDRCVFLADFFGARKIFLFGMDFGKRIGRHSHTRKSDREAKIKKLKHGKSLLEWMATRSDAELFTLSRPIEGFNRIHHIEIGHNLAS